MLNVVAAFSASFGFVFVKAFQQRNVAFAQYAYILPTSLLMATLEVFVVANIATAGFKMLLVAAIGSGSGFGALAATWLHAKLLKGQNREHS